MARIVVGTAGHIDHGKTALTKALTGIDTDRLQEEKDRGISIELGFAPLFLPCGIIAGIVDVPGHEKFVKTMLAGVAGIDMVLLVVATNEGVMPQTKEHLDIINLLGIQQGIIVLTKKDLADEKTLASTKNQVQSVLANTTLANAPILTCSAITGEGLAEVLHMIDKMAQQLPAKNAAGPARLPIDRVFSVSGFGTVVTGTLWQGTLNKEDRVELWPSGKTGRIRALEAHNQQIEMATAGQRVAINLAGIKKEDLARGFWLGTLGFLQESSRLDARIFLLPSAKKLVQRAPVHLHHGTNQTVARIFLLDRNELNPGDSCFCQISIEKPVAAQQGDSYIIRSYSPVGTIGGGKIIDPMAPKHKFLQFGLAAELAAKEASHQNPHDLTTAVNKTAEQELTAKLTETKKILAAYHLAYPLRPGMPIAELKSRVFTELSLKNFQHLLAEAQKEGLLEVEENVVKTPQFCIVPPSDLAKWREDVLAKLASTPFAPPTKEELLTTLPKKYQAKEALAWLKYNRDIVLCEGDVIFAWGSLEAAKKLLVAYLTECESISLAETRDLFVTSRKFALAILTYFDNMKLTKRVGDLHTLV